MANAAGHHNFGNPLAPGWGTRNLVTIKAPNGATWQVHRAAAPHFENFFKDLVAAGYNPGSSGGFNYRNIRGGNRLSQHSYGTAIDIDANKNPLGSKTHALPQNVAELAARHNLEWGGNWQSRPDPMHFEYKAQPGKTYAMPEDMAGPGPGGGQSAVAPMPGGYGGAPNIGANAPPALPPIPQVMPVATPEFGLAEGLSGLAKAMTKSAQVGPPVQVRSGPVGLGGPEYMPLSQRMQPFEPMAAPKSKTLAELLAGVAATL